MAIKIVGAKRVILAVDRLVYWPSNCVGFIDFSVEAIWLLRFGESHDNPTIAWFRESISLV